MSEPLGISPTPGSAPRVLVAYASKSGSTREVAEAIAATLGSRGLVADVRAAPDVASLDGYGAVVLGSGLYAATWLRDANRFIRAHRAALAALPVWLFSSGPLDRSADLVEIPMSPHVGEVLRSLHIRGHRTFGGRLLPDAPEVVAGVMARYRVGDFRDFAAINAWAEAIATALATARA